MYDSILETGKLFFTKITNNKDNLVNNFKQDI